MIARRNVLPYQPAARWSYQSVRLSVKMASAAIAIAKMARNRSWHRTRNDKMARRIEMVMSRGRISILSVIVAGAVLGPILLYTLSSAQGRRNQSTSSMEGSTSGTNFEGSGTNFEQSGTNFEGGGTNFEQSGTNFERAKEAARSNVEPAKGEPAVDAQVLSELSQRMADLEARNASLEQGSSALEQRMSTAERRIAELEQQVKALADQLSQRAEHGPASPSEGSNPNTSPSRRK
jgi:uncharacterized coiled-coil protein SlyX